MEALEREVRKAAEQCGHLQKELKAVRAERTGLDKKLTATQSKLGKALADGEEDRNINAHLRADSQQWKDRVSALEEELRLAKESKDKVSSLSYGPSLVVGSHVS